MYISNIYLWPRHFGSNGRTNRYEGLLSYRARCNHQSKHNTTQHNTTLLLTLKHFYIKVTESPYFQEDQGWKNGSAVKSTGPSSMSNPW